MEQCSHQQPPPPPYSQVDTRTDPPPYRQIRSPSQESSHPVQRSIFSILSRTPCNRCRAITPKDDRSVSDGDRTQVTTARDVYECFKTTTITTGQHRESKIIYRLSRIAGEGASPGNLCIRGSAQILSNAIAENFVISGHAKVTAPLDAEGEVEISGDSEISGSVSAKGKVTIGGNCRFSGSLTCASDATFCSRSRVSGPVHIQGNLTVSEFAHVSGDVVVDGAVLVVGYAQVTGRVVACKGLRVVQWEPMPSMTSKKLGRKQKK